RAVVSRQGVTPVRSALEAIEKHSIPEPNSGCLLWLADLDRDGYARGWIGGRTRRVAPAVYECISGSVPSGLIVDHKCRVRCCVNPDHLRAITQRENVVSGDSPGITRARHARVTHCPQGHEYTAENTIWFKRDGYRYRKCRTCKYSRQRRL